MRNIRIFCVLFLFFISLFAYTQELSTKSKKAGKSFQKATTEYQLLNYTEAIQYLRQAVKQDSHFIEAYLLMGDIYYDQDSLQNAVKWYNKAYELKKDSKVIKNIANLYIKLGKNAEAIKLV